MSRPVLSICTRCDGGDDLLDAVKAERKARDARDLFKVEGVRCLKCCGEDIAIEFEGKKRSTYTRVNVKKKHADRVVDAAIAYARLSPGEELRERDLPGDED